MELSGRHVNTLKTKYWLCQVIGERRLAHRRAAALLGIDQPEISVLVHGHCDDFSTKRFSASRTRSNLSGFPGFRFSGTLRRCCPGWTSKVRRGNTAFLRQGIDIPAIAPGKGKEKIGAVFLPPRSPKFRGAVARTFRGKAGEQAPGLGYRLGGSAQSGNRFLEKLRAVVGSPKELGLLIHHQQPVLVWVEVGTILRQPRAAGRPVHFLD